MNDNINQHYNAGYFKWQSTVGGFGGWANLPKFLPYVNSTDRVIDFGCGGGFLLKNLPCQDKIGIEVNLSARNQAEVLGIKTKASSSEIEDNWADLIISNHALEHVACPLTEIKTLYSKLKPGGKIVFVVPSETIHYSYKPDDINHHLYTWSPMCLGNLFAEAGFKVIEVKPYTHQWPPHYMTIAKIFGGRVFHFVSKIYGYFFARRLKQIRIVAVKN